MPSGDRAPGASAKERLPGATRVRAVSWDRDGEAAWLGRARDVSSEPRPGPLLTPGTWPRALRSAGR